MIPEDPYPYVFWGAFLGLLIANSLWCHFVAYPISFEKHLKKGKPWVYIPIQWKGAYKLQVILFSRLLMLAVVAAGMLLISFYTRRTTGAWLAAYALFLGGLLLQLNSWWQWLRYKQQEDSYYFLLDELRSKMESEGKEIVETSFKSLAAFQHQNLLRKADERGQLIRTLRIQAKKSRKYRRDVHSREPVET